MALKDTALQNLSGPIFNSVDSKFNETFSEEIWFAWN